MNTPDMRLVPAPCYVSSEPHLSGYRLILGYDSLKDVQAAHHSALAASPSPSVGATDKLVSELCAMHRLALAVASAKSDDGIGSFGAEDDLCRAAFSMRLPQALLEAAVEIERLRNTHPAPDASAVREGFTVDDLAQEIRRVDGSHDLGAGTLAEALMPFLRQALTPPEPAGREELREKVAEAVRISMVMTENGCFVDVDALTGHLFAFQNTGRVR